MVQSTIDKIRDTTVWRTIRKLAGVIDDQNTTVSNLQEQLDNFDLDGVKTEVNNLSKNDAVQDADIKVIKSDITVIKGSVSSIGADVNDLTEDVTDHERRLNNAETDILNLRDEDKKLTNALPKTYTLYRNGEGKIQSQVETIDGTLFNSNVLDMVIPYQYDIISGTTERSFKLNITMSDGTSYVTNDFVIPAGGGTEVVVTGITLAKDSSNVNRFHVGINLSDGTMIDSGYITMIDNVSATFADSKLTISVNGVSSVPVTIDTGVVYSGGTGITITSGTIAIDSTVVALKSDIADMETKTNASATYATKTALALTDSVANDANEKANSAIDNVSISGSTMTFTKINDEHIDVEIPSSTVKILPTIWFRPPNLSSPSLATDIYYGGYVGPVLRYLNSTTAYTGYIELPRGASDSVTVYRGTVATTSIDSLIRNDIINFNLDDGKYIFYFCPTLLNCSTTSTDTFGIVYEISDGNLTLTDTESTKRLLGYSSSGSAFDYNLYSIYKS